MVVRTSLFVGFFVGFLAGCKSADPISHSAFMYAWMSCNSVFWNTDIVYYNGLPPTEYCKVYADLAARGKPLPPLP
jgi:hypothetical protein